MFKRETAEQRQARRERVRRECRRNAELQRERIRAREQAREQRRLLHMSAEQMDPMQEANARLMEELQQLRQQVEQLKQPVMPTVSAKVSDDEARARMLLGIALEQEGLTESVVNVFYRQRSKDVHPDVNGDGDCAAFQELTWAKDYLLKSLKK